jgi:DNA-binding CsgD family transcriptional regulator
MRLDKGQIEVIDDVMAGILRKKTPAERIHIGFEMWLSAQKMLFSHLRATYPHWSKEHLNREVARRLSHGRPYELLQKMEYYKEKGSDKHLRDITGILKVSGRDVDREYIITWAKKLGLMEIWEAVEARVLGGK